MVRNQIRDRGARRRKRPEAAAPPSPTKVLDLMAALEASVKAAQAARKESEAKPKAARRRARCA